MPPRSSKSGSKSGPKPGALRPRILSIVPSAAKPPTAPPPAEAAGPQGQDEVEKLDLASLTLDTPLIPLKRAAAAEPKVPSKPFPFLSLPSELRIKVYEHFFADDPSADPVRDLGPDNYKRFHKKLGLVRVCRQVHAEATHFYYSTRPFRVFPTYPGKYFKSRKPILARLRPRQRQCLTSLELRLGPGWSQPPRGWVVNDALGLADCVNVRRLRVFVECDPSDAVFKGFRRSEGFYEGFSRQLLASVVGAMPAVDVVEFDAWTSVRKAGGMMRGLVSVARDLGVKIAWGPERGWTDDMEEDDTPPPQEAIPEEYAEAPIPDHAPANLLVVA